MRPEFWSDALVAAMPPAVRLFYVGLWCVADDYGWLRWNETEIAALLFPYESPKKRVRDVSGWATVLTDSGRLVLYRCGCGCIPTLPRHQVNGGKKSATNRDKHLNGGHSNDRIQAVPEVRDFPLLGNGKERNGSSSGTTPDETTDFKSGMAAAGLKLA